MKQATSTREHWDRHWDEIKSTPATNKTPGVKKILLYHLLHEMAVKGRQILEVGAGSGVDSLYLAELGAQVTILDYSSSALETVRRQVRGRDIESRLQMVRADAASLPFPGSTFDLVFHQGLLEHFREPEPILAEQVRVLRQGAILAVDVPQKYTIYTLKKNLAIRRGKWFAGWETQYSMRELKALIRRVGLTPVRSYATAVQGSWGSIARSMVGSILGIDPKPDRPANDVGGGSRNVPGWLAQISQMQICHLLLDNIGVIAKKE